VAEVADIEPPATLRLEQRFPCFLLHCRHGEQSCCHRDDISDEMRAACKVALGLALGSVARMPVMPQADRSKHRCTHLT